MQVHFRQIVLTALPLISFGCRSTEPYCCVPLQPVCELPIIHVDNAPQFLPGTPNSAMPGEQKTETIIKYVPEVLPDGRVIQKPVYESKTIEQPYQFDMRNVNPHVETPGVKVQKNTLKMNASSGFQLLSIIHEAAVNSGLDVRLSCGGDGKALLQTRLHTEDGVEYHQIEGEFAGDDAISIRVLSRNPGNSLTRAEKIRDKIVGNLPKPEKKK